MLFNSIEFLIFLPIVFLLYWFVFNKNLKYQNILLLISSYLFYGWWDYRFLSLIIISSLVDYIVGIKIYATKNPLKRKRFLFLSIFMNLGLLGYFKYYNFFIKSFINAFSSIGIHVELSSLNIILPVGISFYTFQTLSYSIDVYRGKMNPTRDIIAFFTFVAFFPQLVAGPIERASNLLPQFYKNRQFGYSKAVEGMRQILWGLFKKIVIADNCAQYANEIFSNYHTYSGSELLLGVIYFAFQIYGDFSGYSDIAIGTARLFGFNLMRNFAFPYFSRDIAEFWRRWHISLSTWFRDYLYIPLGGSHGGTFMNIRNTLIIFIVSGFWHGANWTFILWGLLNGLYFIPLMLMKINRKNMDIVSANKFLPSLVELIQILITFFLTLVAWIFFRAENLTHAFNYISHTFSRSLFTVPSQLKYFPFIIILIFIEWIQRDKQHGLQLDGLKLAKFYRWSIYCIIIFMILIFNPGEQQFIYFQF